MIKSVGQILILVVFVAPICASGETCPDGWYALSNSMIALLPVCPGNSIDLGAVVGTCDKNVATCSLDVMCAGAKALRAENGVSVPLYSEKYSSPAIGVAIGNTVCYANLISGGATNTINVKHDNSTWHTAGLRRCVELSPNVVPTMTVPVANAVVWRGVSGSVNLVGTSHCATVSGTVGSTQTALNTTGADTSKYCWCRLLSPAASKWVYAESYSGFGTCNTSCAIACANAFGGNSVFRNAIISSIK